MGGSEVYQPPPPAASHRAMCLPCPSPGQPMSCGLSAPSGKIFVPRRAAGTGLPTHCRSPRRLTSAAAGAPLPPPLMVAVEPSVNMTDACYTNPADATCASFQRTDAGGCCSWAPRLAAKRTIRAGSFRRPPRCCHHCRLSMRCIQVAVNSNLCASIHRLLPPFPWPAIWLPVMLQSGQAT